MAGTFRPTRRIVVDTRSIDETAATGREFVEFGDLATGVGLLSDLDVTFGDGVLVPSTAIKTRRIISFAGTIVSATLLADQAGSCAIDILKSTYAGFPTTVSIVASAPPTLATAQKSQDLTLVGWQPRVVAGDVLEFSLTTVATLLRVTLVLTIRRS